MALNAELVKVTGFADGVAPGSAHTADKVIVNGDVLFTVYGGPVLIDEILSVCISANDATASTLQYSSTPTIGSATAISGATASLASATAGTTIRLAPTALSTAPVISAASAGGVQLGTNVSNRIVVNDGTIKAVVGVGSTTGQWRHYIRYYPLTVGATVR
jgi:hypothetical protein